jgi:hypothetical protein
MQNVKRVKKGIHSIALNRKRKQNPIAVNTLSEQTDPFTISTRIFKGTRATSS